MGTEMFSLQGKVAIVTGGSKGLGYAMAQALAECGADVAISSRTADEVEAAGRELAEATGRRVLALTADASRAEDVDAMTERTIAELGQVDILVNNAGINRHHFIHEMDEAAWNEVLAVDLTGPMLCCRAATRHMIPRGTGRIINISSVFGLVGFAKRASYTAAKGGLVNLSRALAVELAPHGITVNCVCPGPFETPMTAKLVTGEVREEYSRKIPLGRWGRPEELVGAVVYLASDAASFTTGAVLTVDGGWTAQ